MKRMNRLLVATVLLGQLAGMTIPSAYAVTTITSSNKEAVVSSTEQTTASTISERKNQEQQQLEPAPPKQPEYVTEEKTYEDKKLTKVEKVDEENSDPQFLFEKETIEKAVDFKGGIVAGKSEQNDAKTETKLDQLILQKRKDNGEWETVKAIELPEDKENLLNLEPFSIDVQDAPEEVGTYEYRLAVDYEKKTYNGEQLKKVVTHKGAYELGSITIEETQLEESPSSTEEPSATEESQSSETTESTSTEESSTTEESMSKETTSQEETEQSTTESSESSVEGTEETTEQSTDESKAEEDEVPPLDLPEANKDLPKLPQMKVTKKMQEIEAAKNSLINPTSVNVGTGTDGLGFAEYISKIRTVEASTMVTVRNIDKYSAEIVGEFYRSGNDVVKNSSPYLVWSEDKADVTKNAIDFDKDKGAGSIAEGNTSSLANLIRSHNSNGKPKAVALYWDYVNSDYPKRGIGFKNYESDIANSDVAKNPFVNLKPGTKYYFNVYHSSVLDGRLSRMVMHDTASYSEDTDTDGDGGTDCYYFKTQEPTPLTVSKPVLESKVNNGNDAFSIGMSREGTYTGDLLTKETTPNATDDDVKGYMNFWRLEWSATESKFNWVYQGNNKDRGTTSTFANGKYSKGEITRLDPGRKYRINVVRKELSTAGDGWGRSDFAEISTKVKPLVPTNTLPNVASESYNKAKVTIDAAYEAHDDKPNATYGEVKLQMQDMTAGASGFTDFTDTDKITQTPNYNNNKIKFDIKDLKANNEYRIRFAVKTNAGWSAYSGATRFTTRAVPVTMETPNFTKSDNSTNSTDTSITMEANSAEGSNGDYKYWGNLKLSSDGNASPGVLDYATKNDAGDFVYIGNNNGWNGGTGTTSTFANGKYSKGSVTSLNPGTQYELRMVQKQAFDLISPNAYSGRVWADTKVKPNNIESNNIITPEPTGWDTATATITTTYQGKDALPSSSTDDIKAEITVPGSDSWGSQKVESASVSTSTDKKVTIKLHNLESNKEYKIRYKIKNRAGWSANSAEKTFKTAARPVTMSTPVYKATNDTTLEMIPNPVVNANDPGNPGDYYYWGDLDNQDLNGYTNYYKRNANNEWTRLGNNLNQGTVSYFENGIYTRGKLTGLDPGTNYRLLLTRRQAITPEEYAMSAFAFASTPVRVNSPTADRTETSPAEAENHAKASIYVTFSAYDALPTRYEVQVKEGGADSSNSWVVAEQDPATSGDANTPSQRLNLKNLKSKTKYGVRYRAENDGGWSDSWSGTIDFQTQGIALKISQPKFYQEDAEPTKVTMKPGTYTGDTYEGSDSSIQSELLLTSLVDGNSTIHATEALSYSNGAYNSGEHDFTGLYPGSTYRVYANIPDYEGVIRSGKGEGNDYDGGDFTTPTRLTAAGSVSHAPTGYDNATVTVSGIYEAGGPNINPAHPRNRDDFSIKYKKAGDLDWINVDDHPENLVGDPTINEADKKVSFTLGGLIVETSYEVKYSVKNASEVWSEPISATFETGQQPDGLYIRADNLSGFHFGNGLTTSPNTQSIGLAAPLIGSVPQSGWINIDNIGVTNNWKMGATLSKITKVGDDNVELTGATLTIGKALEKRDLSGTWGTVSSSDPVDGLADTNATLVQDEPQILWKSTNATYGQGYFRHMIDHDSVQLMIPGNSGQLQTQYEGEVRWTLIDAL